jgi:hypothetical protein
MAHIIAHIENGKQFFNITSAYWGGPVGFEYDDRFPPFVNRVVREIDIKYGLGQDRSYHFITPFEPDWATEDDWSGEWPVWDRDYGDIFDATVSYIYAISKDNPTRMIDGKGNDLESMACDLAGWKSEFRAEQAKYHHKPEVVERDEQYDPTHIEWRGKVWEISNER